MSSANREVTVVITCYEYGAFLAESVRSALEQEGGEPRVIVVDDGSRDPATLAAIERLPPQVQLIRQENAGLAAARDAGLRLARTPFLLSLDADDMLARGALQTLRSALLAAPAAGYSYGAIRFFEDWNGVMRLPPYDPYRLLFRHIVGPSALMRRELFTAVGGYDARFRGYEDWELWVHALAHGWEGARVGEVTHLYRRHGTTMYHGARAHYRSVFGLMRSKHAELYTTAAMRELAARSELGPLARFAYRWWWGRRPLPARVELALQSVLWRPRGRSSALKSG
ncbi:MAG TPA: glycosyltransferase family 2 protein [Solirubrobacteraceae bacterium]|jgi:glycosyltransferase involved in cell wall biosynthesis|nr:glycosyltransferase family 2 protein [Solirubrobacteraceae bacterium]